MLVLFLCAMYDDSVASVPSVPLMDSLDRKWKRGILQDGIPGLTGSAQPVNQ